MQLTTVMVTHDVLEAVLLADRIVVMRHGAIAAAGTPREIMSEHGRRRAAADGHAAAASAARRGAARRGASE